MNANAIGTKRTSHPWRSSTHSSGKWMRTCRRFERALRWPGNGAPRQKRRPRSSNLCGEKPQSRFEGVRLSFECSYVAAWPEDQTVRTFRRPLVVLLCPHESESSLYLVSVTQKLCRSSKVYLVQ